jgi:hypothetical protein
MDSSIPPFNRSKTPMSPLGDTNAKKCNISSEAQLSLSKSVVSAQELNSMMESMVSWIEKDSTSEPEKYLEKSKTGGCGE